MPNIVLFPSNDPAKDFAHDNDNIDRGWVKIADNENLGTMAAAIPQEVENDNNDGGNNDGNVAKKRVIRNQYRRPLLISRRLKMTLKTMCRRLLTNGEACSRQLLCRSYRE